MLGYSFGFSCFPFEISKLDSQYVFDVDAHKTNKNNTARTLDRTARVRAPGGVYGTVYIRDLSSFKSERGSWRRHGSGCGAWTVRYSDRDK